MLPYTSSIELPLLGNRSLISELARVVPAAISAAVVAAELGAGAGTCRITVVGLGVLFLLNRYNRAAAPPANNNTVDVFIKDF
jgi:hypothetical protein